jgi:predicted Zn-dependent protease
MKRWKVAPLTKKLRRKTQDSAEAAVQMSRGVTGADALRRRTTLLDRALERWPGSIALLLERARVAREGKQFMQAEALLLRARAVDPGDVRVRADLGLTYLASNRLAEAEAALLDARQVAPSSVPVLQTLAALYAQLARSHSRKVARGGRRRSQGLPL